MKNATNILKQAKEAIRSHGFAWPGGYPLFGIMAGGEPLSIDAIRDNWRDICAATIHGDRFDSWRLEAIDINYEDSQLYCAHTGNRIESAYGEDEITESI